MVRRQTLDALCTIGVMLLDGIFECYTLEDRVRAPGEKVPGSTAIPPGRYRVAMTFSQRFQRALPQLLGVPNFSGIRIHAGNTDQDTEGCILVGKDRHPDWIGRSREALAELLPKIEAGLSAGEVWCMVENYVQDPTKSVSGDPTG